MPPARCIKTNIPPVNKATKSKLEHSAETAFVIKKQKELARFFGCLYLTDLCTNFCQSNLGSGSRIEFTCGSVYAAIFNDFTNCAIKQDTCASTIVRVAHFGSGQRQSFWPKVHFKEQFICQQYGTNRMKTIFYEKMFLSNDEDVMNSTDEWSLRFLVSFMSLAFIFGKSDNLRL